MTKPYKIKEDARFYKSLRLKNDHVVVEIKEKAPWTESSVSIFHSPAKELYSIELGQIIFRKSQGFNDYVDMLIDFRERYKEDLKDLA